MSRSIAKEPPPDRPCVTCKHYQIWREKIGSCDYAEVNHVPMWVEKIKMFIDAKQEGCPVHEPAIVVNY